MPTASEPPELAHGIDDAAKTARRAPLAADGLSQTARDYARRLYQLARLDVDRAPVGGPSASRGRVSPNEIDARSEAARWARSGAMALTGPADGTPRFARAPLASVTQAIGHLLTRLAPGSALARIDYPSLLGERAALAGLSRRADVSAGRSARLISTRDGTIAVNLPRPEDWALVAAWLEADSAFDGSDPARGFDRIGRIVAKCDGTTLVERARLIGLAVSPAPRRVPSVSSPFEWQHEVESAHEPRRRPHPLRVLDLSTLWAGPLAASLMALTGHDVLKVESPERPDGARRGPRAFFDLMNGDKRGCALDLRDRLDRGRFERLLDAADIVIESARPRGLAQLGYDVAGILATDPGKLWISITGFGRDEPGIAFGDDAAAAAGLAWSPDPAQHDPCFCADAIADPLTGLHAAYLALAWAAAGRGGLLDVSLAGVSSFAAAVDGESLLRPIEKTREGFVVREPGGEAQAIEGPRASRPSGRAAALLPPSDELLSVWTHPRC